MALFAKTSDAVANGFNIFIALMLFLVMPVIITLAYKYNQRMNAVSKGKDEQPVKNEPAEIEAQPEEPEELPSEETED